MYSKMEDEGQVSRASSICREVLIVSAFFAFVATLIMNAILNIPGLSPFNVTIGDLSHEYPTPITPSDATFGIWGVIYLWQLVITVYCLTLICRKCNGSPLYINPGVVPSIFFVSYIINLLGNVGWIYVWLSERFTLALNLLIIGVCTLVICLHSSCRELEKCGSVLESSGCAADIWCIRIIVQNGIAFYLAWVTCATSINAIVVLHYVMGVSMANAVYGALITLNVVVVGWFVLEIVYDRQLRYVFSHYITYVAAFSGIYVRNYDPSVSYEIYALVLLILVVVLTVTKLIIMIVKSVKDPIHYPQVQDDKGLIKHIHAEKYGDVPY